MNFSLSLFITLTCLYIIYFARLFSAGVRCLRCLLSLSMALSQYFFTIFSFYSYQPTRRSVLLSAYFTLLHRILLLPTLFHFTSKQSLYSTRHHSDQLYTLLDFTLHFNFTHQHYYNLYFIMLLYIFVSVFVNMFICHHKYVFKNCLAFYMCACWFVIICRQKGYVVRLLKFITARVTAYCHGSVALKFYCNYKDCIIEVHQHIHIYTLYTLYTLYICIWVYRYIKLVYS